MRLLKNQFQNFVKPYHEELSSKAWSMWPYHLPQNIFFWKLQVIIRLLSCWQQDSLLLTYPGIYPQIYQGSPCPGVLIVRRYNEKQRRSRIILNFTKVETFHLLWQPRDGGNLTMRPPSCTLQKGLPLPFTLAKKRTYLDTELKEELTDLFWKLPGCSLFQQSG